MKTFKTAIASLTLATLLMGQSAFAATRSFDSLPSSGVKAVAAERAGASVGAAEQFGEEADGFGLIVLIFGSAAAAVAFLEAVGVIDLFGGKDSPG